MATTDQAFLKKLRATFNAEAQEHLQTIASMLLELEKSPPSDRCAAVIEGAYREAHSLKGASRAVDLSDIEAVCQAVEGVFAAWKRQPPSLAPEMFDTLHRAVDSIRELLTAADGGSPGHDRPKRDTLIGHLLELQTPAETGGEPPRPAAPAPPPILAPPPPLAPPPVQPAEAKAAAPESAPAAVIDTVRIPVAKLDARLLQAEEMLILKSKAAQRTEQIRQMSGSLERWWQEWAKVASQVRSLRRAAQQEPAANADAPAFAGGAALARFLDWNCDCLRSLEGKLSQLAAQAEQDRRAVCRQVDDLLENSKQLLMLPFSTVADLFSKLVRDLCRDQGKEADLTIKGGEVGIDKRILEEMKDALIHVLRNCVDHGVERPEVRKRLNKPPRASITVAVSQVNGDKVEIRISDDGAGVETANVRKAAVAHGIISDGEARAMNEEQSLGLIFHSGISTSAIVTEISGRGLGMAILRTKVEKMGGKISIQSRRNAGTTLRILLPLTLATFRGVRVCAAGDQFIIPTVSIERVLRVRPSDIQTVENREMISVQGRAASLAHLSAVLGLSGKGRRGDNTAPIPVVILHSADQRIAFAVDEVLGEGEVLVKPFRKPLTRVPNLAGATVLVSGKAVPVLNVSDLMKSARASAPGRVAKPAGAGSQPPRCKRVLVVEDSITSRTLLKGILETADYEVKTAVDGVDAFTALREQHFDLVVSDVEMPRMNGLDLTARIRADDRLSEMPVVLVTALESRQERERGIDVGANAYVVKSSFDQSNLLEVVGRFI